MAQVVKCFQDLFVWLDQILVLANIEFEIFRFKFAWNITSYFQQEYGTKLEQLIVSSQAEIEKSCFAKVAVAGFFKLMASNFISSISSLSKSSKNYTSVLHSDVSCSLMKSRSDLSNQIRNINNTIKQLEQKNEPKELTEAKRLFDSVDSVVKSAQEKLPKELLETHFALFASRCCENLIFFSSINKGAHTSYDHGSFQDEKRTPWTWKIKNLLQTETRQYGKWPTIRR